eukprot:TRINITY_DN2958_c0_g1_i1.p1 TRINITY_DN2958_c0_g1~~TRINITY_DN2958_c0_g1_i1.p1  ORF type:complete len:410 (+),score=50.22 TRINITY_DN2958_c0_g1_i1:98-1327(+)
MIKNNTDARLKWIEFQRSQKISQWIQDSFKPVEAVFSQKASKCASGRMNEDFSDQVCFQKLSSLIKYTKYGDVSVEIPQVGRDKERDLCVNFLEENNGGCIFLCGPPATGKTMLMQILRKECAKKGEIVDFNCRHSIKGFFLDNLSGIVTGKTYQSGEFLHKALHSRRYIIFMDELEGLTECKGLIKAAVDSNSKSFLIVATNEGSTLMSPIRDEIRHDSERLVELQLANYDESSFKSIIRSRIALAYEEIGCGFSSMEGIISSEVIDEACRSCDLRHILDTISYSLIESKRRLQSLFEKECSKNQKWEYSGPLVTWGDLKRSQGVPVGGPMKVFKDAELSFRLAAISCLLVWCKNFKLEGQYSVVLLKEVVAYAKAHFSHLIRTEVDWEYMVRKLNMANILEVACYPY